MFNLITAVNGKLDDPLMKKWALKFYSELPKRTYDERVQIETDWFHELFIAQLIERGETTLLSRLLWELPPQHLSNLKTLFIKNWATWPTSLIGSAARVLVVIDPEELLHLFENDLKRFKQGDIDPNRFEFISQLRTHKNDVACTALLKQVSQLVIDKESNVFWKFTLINSLLKVSLHLDWDTFESSINSVLQIKNNQSHPRHFLESLFTGLFGHVEFLSMIFDREQFESSLRLTALQPFFVDSAPLEKLDNWLQLPPRLKETLKVLENLSHESPSCGILLRLLRDSSCISKKLSTKIQVQLSIAACLHGFAKSALDTSKLDLMTTVNLLAADLDNPRWTNDLIDHLRGFDQSSVISALTFQLSEDIDSYGAIQIAQAMGDLAYPAFVAPLILVMAKDQGDFIKEAAATSLTEIGSSAQTALIEQWDSLDSSQKIYGISIISRIHGKAAVDFAVTRFSELMTDDMESACDLILAAPDSRLLELLKPQLRRKQPLIDRTFYICARLFNYDGPETQEAKERALIEFERLERAFDNFKSMKTDDLLNQNQLFLELACPLCHDVNRYQAKGVIVSSDPEADFLLNDEFPCASCGQDVEFEMTSMAKMTLSLKFLGSQIIAKAGHLKNDQFKTINYTVDGYDIPLAKALALRRDYLAKHPNDAKQWFIVGNLLSHLNRPKQTMAAYLKALKNEPNAVDVSLAIAIMLDNNEMETEAWEIMQKALKELPSWKFLMPSPDFNEEFVEFYNFLRKALGKYEMPALLPSALSSSKKTGRNESCPCGSGKKFKKCCGR